MVMHINTVMWMVKENATWNLIKFTREKVGDNRIFVKQNLKLSKI